KPGQIALAWLLARSPVMLPIPGTSRPEHLEENFASRTVQLSQEEVTSIAAAARAEEHPSAFMGDTEATDAAADAGSEPDDESGDLTQRQSHRRKRYSDGAAKLPAL